MTVFNISRDDEIKFDAFTTKLDGIYSMLEPFEKEMCLTDILSIKKSFIAKTNDFYRADRKLNIGIIGRVKSGKSTLLNSLLFGGKNILPMAATPKTATLTRIEYARTNSLEIEFYNKDEWEKLKDSLDFNSGSFENIVAKEIMDMVNKKSDDIVDYVGTPDKTIEYGSYEELLDELNDYVGENGKYTPVVKMVTLHINQEDMEDISIVDTPGLNDPVVSRTYQTKRFIELCDVVIFLSKASTFLDINDLDLLVSQFPQKGIKKLVLVCSRFDDGVRDVIWTSDSLRSAALEVKNRLTEFTFTMLHSYKKNNFFVKDDIIEQLKSPIFISSLVHNMSCKDKKEYTVQEERIYEDLNIRNDLKEEDLVKIGNMQALENILDDIIDEKEEILEKKSTSFVPTAMEELKVTVARIIEQTEKRITRLNQYDREQILKQKKLYTKQITGIKASLEEIFGNWYGKLETNKSQAIRNLRGYYREYLQLTEKEGIKTHFETRKVSGASWFKPWTWGNSSREIYSYDERYKYIDASDALENIRNFANEAAVNIESTFQNSCDIAYTKHELLNTVIEHFDVTADSYSPEYYKMLVDKILNGVEFPIVEINVADYISCVANQFFGEIRDNVTRTELKQALAKAIGDLFNYICSIFDYEAEKFKNKINQMKEEFGDEILKDICGELDVVLVQYKDKEKEIKRSYQLIDKLKEIENELD